MIRFYFILFLFLSCRLFADVDAEYERALHFFDSGKYKLALSKFRQLQVNYPLSGLAMSAELKISEISYVLGRCDDAIAAAENYIRLHPGAQNLDHAYYLRALSNYHHALSVEHDQNFSAKALEELDEFCVVFPDSEYIVDIKAHYRKIRDLLSAKELYIANFYLERKQYVSALTRLINLAEQYKDTTYYPNAIYYIAEIYKFFGLHEEAKLVLQNKPELK
jgi:outer membrane protein assembly factor BamD